MRRFYTLFILVCLAMLPVAGQQSNTTTAERQSNNVFDRFGRFWKANLYDNKIFSRLDVGAGLGSDGIGLDISTNITDFVRLRGGLSWMPGYKVPMHFDLENYTSEGGVNNDNFDDLASHLHRFTGLEVDKRVDVDGQPDMLAAKVLVDVYPVKNCGWHITGGFFWGSSRVAKAKNTQAEMSSLLAVNIYNHVGQYFESDEAYDPVLPGVSFSPDFIDTMREKFDNNGVMGIHIGDFKDGTPYMMQPDSEGMVKASAFVNRFRPYVGTGWTSQLDKAGRWHFDVDCGVMFWGGSPKIVTHDGINLCDLDNIRGKVGDYVDIAKSLKVYPTVSVRFSYTIF